MTEDELLFAFSRMTSTPESIVFECLVIDWMADGTALERWEEAQRLSAGSTPRELEAARRQLLRRWRHFLHCDRCHRRVPAVFMHRGTLCHSCASGKLRKQHPLPGTVWAKAPN